MAIESRYTTTAGKLAIGQEAENLLTSLKAIKYQDLNPGGRIFTDPVAVMVSVELAKGSLATLSRLSGKVDIRACRCIDKALERAKEKLQFTEKVMEFVLDQQDDSVPISASRDPRIEKILAKLIQMQQAPPPLETERTFAFEKLNRYFEKASRVYCDHLPTEIAFGQAISIIGELKVRVLQSGPLACIFQHQLLSNKHNPHYEDLANVDICKKMAGASYSIIYLNMSMLDPYEGERFNHAAFAPVSELHAHEWTAKWIKENPSKNTLSLSDALGDYYGQFLIEVPFTEGILAKRPELRQARLSYSCDAHQKEIQRELDTLIELKNSDNKPLGVFIEMGSQTFAIVFHISGRISLFNPYGSQEMLGNNFSYEVHFANSGQAASCLTALTAEMGPSDRITFSPYHNREGKFETESTDSSSEEDNDFIDDNNEMENALKDFLF